MPVGTRGAVKGITHRDVEDAGAEIILGNTYHLHLRPGDELIARAGGLHAFIGWPRPILTDSGGYQVFSLAAMRQVTEEGREFRSHLDGALRLLSPESATDIQARLGSDIAMVLDECVASRRPDRLTGAAATAMERSVRWARRGARSGCCSCARIRRVATACRSPTRARRSSASSRAASIPACGPRASQATVAIGFEAYAIGGLSVGEPVDVMYEVVGHTAPQLPADRPRYLMGTGMPDDLVECVARGIDMFDCVLPTRNARNGQLLTRRGVLVIKNAQYAEDRRPPDPGLRLLHLPALQPGLSAPPFHGRRDDGRDPAHRP